MKNLKNRCHKKRIEQNSDYCTAGCRIPYPPGGQRIPYKKSKPRKPKHTFTAAIAEILLYNKQWYQRNENQWCKTMLRPGSRQQQSRNKRKQHQMKPFHRKKFVAKLRFLHIVVAGNCKTSFFTKRWQKTKEC